MPGPHPLSRRSPCTSPPKGPCSPGSACKTARAWPDENVMKTGTGTTTGRVSCRARAQAVVEPVPVFIRPARAWARSGNSSRRSTTASSWRACGGIAAADATIERPLENLLGRRRRQPRRRAALSRAGRRGADRACGLRHAAGRGPAPRGHVGQAASRPDPKGESRNAPPHDRPLPERPKRRHRACPHADATRRSGHLPLTRPSPAAATTPIPRTWRVLRVKPFLPCSNSLATAQTAREPQNRRDSGLLTVLWVLACAMTCQRLRKSSAERTGFEPADQFPGHRFSKPALSTTQPPLQVIR